MRIFGNKKPKPVPATVPEVLANESGRFYKMYRLSATSKTLIYVFGIGFMGYSFIFGEGNDDKAKDHIAVVTIGGAMEAGSKTGDGLIIAEAIRDAYKNRHAKAILIQADSGGGSPSEALNIYNTLLAARNNALNGGITVDSGEETSPKETTSESIYGTELSNRLFSAIESGVGKFKKSDLDHTKPVIVSVKNLCASACYYAVSAADAIYADKASIIGSIGVRMDSWDFSNVMDKYGVKHNTLTAGRYKDSLDPWHPIQDETRQFMQDHMLTPLHSMFIGDVEKARDGKILNSNEADKADLFSGRFWVADTAKKYGLIDGVVTTDQVKYRLSELYGTTSFIGYNSQPKSLRSLVGLSLNSFTNAMESLSSIADNVSLSTSQAGLSKLQ